MLRWSRTGAISSNGPPPAARLPSSKANAIWKQALAEYQEPAIDPAIREELVAFVERRIREGGEKTDF